MNVLIAGYARTPYTKISGPLASLTAVQLGAVAVKQAMINAGVDALAVEHVIGGQVIQTGCGQNPARQTAVASGIGNGVPAITINSVCLSGADAVIQGSQLIELGLAQVVVVVGQESMSNSPHAMLSSRSGKKYGQITMIDTLEIDGLTDAFSGDSMGLATQKVTDAAGITRERQDQVAVNSHLRATASREWVNGEIAPVTISSRSGETVVSDDDGIRGETTLESLSALRSAFTKDGTITAGNSSPLTDGAAALVLVSQDFAAQNGLKPLGRIAGYAKVAGPDYSLNLQPSKAIQAALKRAGKTVADLDQVEINEAFAAVGVASTEALGISPDRVNIDGGAIALGHPIGSSGTRIVGHLARNLQREGSGALGAIGICGGGGQGVAILVEAL
jgi:acetyl-CoA C-acetyltransferase